LESSNVRFKKMAAKTGIRKGDANRDILTDIAHHLLGGVPRNVCGLLAFVHQPDNGRRDVIDSCRRSS
jgi:hypothetical protein